MEHIASWVWHWLVESHMQLVGNSTHVVTLRYKGANFSTLSSAPFSLLNEKDRPYP